MGETNEYFNRKTLTACWWRWDIHDALLRCVLMTLNTTCLFLTLKIACDLSAAPIIIGEIYTLDKQRFCSRVGNSNSDDFLAKIISRKGSYLNAFRSDYSERLTATDLSPVIAGLLYPKRYVFLYGRKRDETSMHMRLSLSHAYTRQRRRNWTKENVRVCECS